MTALLLVGTGPIAYICKLSTLTFAYLSTLTHKLSAVIFVGLIIFVWGFDHVKGALWDTRTVYKSRVAWQHSVISALQVDMNA